MPRGPAYLPHDCPWAALVARGLITASLASQYRRGGAIPGAARVRLLRELGYPVEIATDYGVHRAVCTTWPERLPDWATPVLAACGWGQALARVLDAALRVVLVSGRHGDWHAEVVAVAPDGTLWPRAIVIARPTREDAEAAVLAAWREVRDGR